MGREVLASCSWKGQTAQATLMLESQEIILRGALRARIPRQSITAISVDEDDLVLAIGTDRLSATLGRAVAERWAAAIRKPPPSLASKLGIGETQKAYIFGQTEDPVLLGAIESSITAQLADASLLIAILERPAELEEMLELARTVPAIPVWCIYAIGRSAPVGDTQIRTYMRSQGYMDNKSCAVSERLTATRYQASSRA